MSGDQDNGTSHRTSTPAVVIVRVPRPKLAPRWLVTKKMRAAIGDYEHLPGLEFKAFTFERSSGDYGGIYFWSDPAGAARWFSPEWFARVREQRGSDASVRFFDAPVSIDNTPGGTCRDEHAGAVGTLVEIAVPPGVDRSLIEAGIDAAAPSYRSTPGLLRKHFIVSDAGTFGGVYIWRDGTSATAWFNQAWHERIRSTYGSDARIEWFDIPILLPGSSTPPRAHRAGGQ